MKEFPVKERLRFTFRWEMYNAFNHTQFPAQPRILAALESLP
jgi:hypothetical protein